MLGSRCPRNDAHVVPPRCAGSSAAARRSQTTVILGCARSTRRASGAGASRSIARRAAARLEPVARTSSSRALSSEARPTVRAAPERPELGAGRSVRRTARVRWSSRDPGSSNATCPSVPGRARPDRAAPRRAGRCGARTRPPGRRRCRRADGTRAAGCRAARGRACAAAAGSPGASAGELVERQHRGRSAGQLAETRVRPQRRVQPQRRSARRRAAAAAPAVPQPVGDQLRRESATRSSSARTSGAGTGCTGER